MAISSRLSLLSNHLTCVDGALRLRETACEPGQVIMQRGDLFAFSLLTARASGSFRLQPAANGSVSYDENHRTDQW